MTLVAALNWTRVKWNEINLVPKCALLLEKSTITAATNYAPTYWANIAPSNKWDKIFLSSSLSLYFTKLKRIKEREQQQQQSVYSIEQSQLHPIWLALHLSFLQCCLFLGPQHIKVVSWVATRERSQFKCRCVCVCVCDILYTW